MGSIIHLFPFQRSARVTRAPEPSIENPTAVQADEEAHDAACKLLTRAPAGSGMLSTLQSLPSHRSARVTPMVEDLT
jgi:hypothetical protein